MFDEEALLYSRGRGGDLYARLAWNPDLHNDTIEMDKEELWYPRLVHFMNEYEEDGKRNNKQNWVILLPFMLSKYCIYSIASVSSL